MAELFPSLLVYDRVVAGVYPTPIDGTNSRWTTPTGIIPLGFASGTRTPVNPFPSENSTQDAIVFNTFGNSDWYDRIHVIPRELALGNIISTQVRNIEIFNSFRIDKLYTAFVNNIPSTRYPQHGLLSPYPCIEVSRNLNCRAAPFRTIT